MPLNNKVEIKFIDPVFGRGVFATCNISENEHVFSSEVLTLSKEDSLIIQSTSLKYYVYSLNKDQDCLAVGPGTLLNHSNNPNLEYCLTTIVENGVKRTLISYKALREIESGEELFIDYNSDCANLDLESAIKSAPLLGAND